MRHVIPQQPYLCRRQACQVITTWRLLTVIACNLCEVIAIYSAPKIIITKKNCERFKCYAGIDPYSVSANFFPWSMDKWSEVEFPDMVNYFHFSTSKLAKNTSKPTNVFSPTKTSLLMVWEVSLWEKWPQIVNTLQDDGSKKCNLQNLASSRLKLRLLLFVLHRKICLNFSRYGRHITFLTDKLRYVNIHVFPFPFSLIPTFWLSVCWKSSCTTFRFLFFLSSACFFRSSEDCELGFRTELGWIF